MSDAFTQAQDDESVEKGRMQLPVCRLSPTARSDLGASLLSEGVLHGRRLKLTQRPSWSLRKLRFAGSASEAEAAAEGSPLLVW